MKVLLVAPMEKSGLTGGQARAAAILSAGLRARGDVRLFHCVQPHRQEARGKWDMAWMRIRHYLDLFKLLARERPDVAHFFSPCSTPAIVEKAILSLGARTFRVATLINLRNDPLPFFFRLSTARRWLVRKSLRMHSTVLCQYSALRTFYIDDIGFPADRVFVAPNAIVGQSCGCSRDVAEQRYSGRHIIYLGSLQRRKGVDVLLRAAALMEGGEDIQLDVVGDAQPAAYLEELRAVASVLGLSKRVTFHGALFGEKKRKVLDGSAVLVLPSRAEGFPNVALEAASLGLPVILTCVGAGEEIADAFGCGALLVPVDDAHGLSRALTRVLGDASTYYARSAAASSGASHFTVGRMCEQVVTAYVSTSPGPCSHEGSGS